MSATLRTIPQHAPSAARLVTYARRQRWAIPLTRALIRPYVRFTSEGSEALPRQGPVLILSNHLSFFDPLAVMFEAGRPVQFMASEALLQGRFGRFLTLWGLVPKKKFTRDERAVALLRGWLDVGAAVGLFPEGQRSWDGRPVPLRPGTARFVAGLGVPVVCARLYNADRQWPRWAVRPRHGRIHVVFDPPRTFPAGATPEEIHPALVAGLRVDPETSPRWPVWGSHLAEGLTNLLFACPSCGAVEGLVERGDEIRCAACASSWRVGPDNTICAPRGSPEPIAAASDRIRARLAEEGYRDPALPPGVLLQSQPVTLVDRSGPAPAVVGEGRLVLTPDHLRLEGSTPWSLPLTALASVSAEQRRRLWLRTATGLFEPVMPTESVVKWEWLTERARSAKAGL